MSYPMEIADGIIKERLQDNLNHKTSQYLLENFKQYCEWCWGHSYGDCDLCRKRFNKAYASLKEKEKPFC